MGASDAQVEVGRKLAWSLDQLDGASELAVLAREIRLLRETVRKEAELRGLSADGDGLSPAALLRERLDELLG